MRITNSILTRDSLAHIQSHLRPIAQAQAQVSTGIRVQKGSDDPAAAAGVMRASNSIRAAEQYKRNIGSATARVNAEESVLDQLGQLLTRARELGISQNSSTADAATNAAALAELDSLLGFAADLANTRAGDEYLFGGDSSSAAPVPDPANPLAQPLPTGVRRTEVSPGRYVQAGHDAATVFGASGALSALSAMKTALQTNDRAGMATASAGLEGAFGKVQALVGDVGARTNQLEVTSANLDALQITLTTFRSDLQEVDLEAAMTQLVTRQTAYQSAMLATSKVLSLNLADYLR